MGRHGLSYRWDIGQRDGRIHVSCIVTHKAGHSETVTMDAAPDNSGKKNSIQQIASSVTYLQRYTLLAIAGLATKSGATVNAQTALETSTALACARVIAEGLSQVPFKLFRETANGGRDPELRGALLARGGELTWYPRYMKAIVVRLDKLKADKAAKAAERKAAKSKIAAASMAIFCRR